MIMASNNTHNRIIGLGEKLLVNFPEASRRQYVCTRSVSFCSNSTLRLYDPSSDDGGEDHEYNPWYNTFDYKLFQRDTKTEVLAIRVATDEFTHDETHDVVDVCRTGIEMYTSRELAREVLERRRLHKAAVLGEYCHQEECGHISPKSLRAVSREYSRWARAAALERAGGIPKAKQHQQFMTSRAA
ncbi:hypothetical protein ACHAXS_006689 [Conticribra weissflogii]